MRRELDVLAGAGVRPIIGDRDLRVKSEFRSSPRVKAEFRTLAGVFKEFPQHTKAVSI